MKIGYLQYDILELLQHDAMTVNELLNELRVARSTIRNNLQFLKTHELIKSEPRGRHKIYSITKKGLKIFENENKERNRRKYEKLIDLSNLDDDHEYIEKWSWDD